MKLYRGGSLTVVQALNFGVLKDLVVFGEERIVSDSYDLALPPSFGLAVIINGCVNSKGK
jgi:hypothetical protein